MVDDTAKTDDTAQVDQPATDDAAVQPQADQPAAGAGKTDQYGRQMFEVTCSSCGKPAQVPFKPSGDRPVYCKDCYMQQRGNRPGGGMNRGPRKQF